MEKEEDKQENIIENKTENEDTRKEEIEALNEAMLDLKISSVKEEEKPKDIFDNDKYRLFISKLKRHQFKNIIFMVGAGISTSSGIPDFRSRNGIFQQLKVKYNLSAPEEFFSLKFFKKKPELFYEFTKNFIEKEYEPSPFHVKLNSY